MDGSSCGACCVSIDLSKNRCLTSRLLFNFLCCLLPFFKLPTLSLKLRESALTNSQVIGCISCGHNLKGNLLHTGRMFNSLSYNLLIVLVRDLWILLLFRKNSSPKCDLTFVGPRVDGKLCWPIGRVHTVDEGYIDDSWVPDATFFKIKKYPFTCDVEEIF